MPVSEAQKRATQKWQRKVYRYTSFKLHTIHDKDIIDWIDGLRKNGTSFNSYLKKLIREDMKKQAEE